MKIDTTIIISELNKQIIVKKADTLGISINEIIIIYLKVYLQKQKKKHCVLKRLSYQKNENNETLIPQHIWIDADLYEKCKDIRKFHNISVSFALAIAIKLYSDEIFSEITDNYREEYYHIHFLVNKIVFKIIAWQKPPEKIRTKINHLFKNT